MAQAGFYVASHPWLGGGRHKVGHSGSLGDRLHGDAYVTCFVGPWHYVYTLETADKEQAARVEAAVLHCTRALRSNEVVPLAALDLALLALRCAARMGVDVVPRVLPCYPRARPRKPPAPCGTPPEPLDCLEGLVLAGPGRGPAATPADIADLLREVAESNGDTDGGPDGDLVGDLDGDTDGDPDGGPDGDLVGDDRAIGKNVPSKARGAPRTPQCAEEPEEEPGDLEGLEEEPPAAGASYRTPALDPRPYQQEAAARCAAELEKSGRAVLQMACRTGKTLVAHLLQQAYDRVLFLVPGLALLRQTAAKLRAYGEARPLLLVGSDGEGATTDPAAVRAFLARPRCLVLSTYQSAAAALLLEGADAGAGAGPSPAPYGLLVQDECHRTCGGRAARPFNLALLRPPAGARLLHMTATPRCGDCELGMQDRALYGGVAYRYYLRQGIDAGTVNDFELRLQDTGGDMPAAVAEALAHLARGRPAPKLLVFARSIAHAAELRDAAPPGALALLAHSRMPRAEVAAALRAFAGAAGPAVLYNCRLLQEGVEIPPLDAVLFAAPRSSPRDIVQSLCRPLNVCGGKPRSVVFVPLPRGEQARRYGAVVPFADALASEDPRFYEHLLNPGQVPYPLAGPAPVLAAARQAWRYGAAAAAGAPGRDRLLRPERVPWGAAYAELRRTVEVCGRYPKTNDGFVLGRGSGAPVMGFYAWYRWAARAYRQGALQPHQVADLEALPSWRTRGLEGPYPWAECMQHLEALLERTGGRLEAIDIHRGGWVGLDATPMERLSGALTTVSQRDGCSQVQGRPRPRQGFLIPPEQAADLDRIFGRWGLRWRKDRDAEGRLLEAAGKYTGRPTCIQEAYRAFKALAARAAGGDAAAAALLQRDWPGYPGKHMHQELPAVWRGGLAPPRMAAGRAVRRGPRGAAAGADGGAAAEDGAAADGGE